MRTTGFVIALVLLAAGPAAAQKVKLSGGPADDAATVGALEKARTLMAVCWQRKPPSSVSVTLAVAASGEVTKATAKTKGPAAQCAAGILAVATLAPTAKAWKGTVEIATAGAGKGEDVQTIHAALAANASSLLGCQAKAPAFVGRVTLRVTVESSGKIAAATADVAETTGGTAKEAALVAKCVAAAAKPLTLDPIASPSVTYELGLTFSGGSAGGGSSGGTAADPALKPSKKGPLDGDAVTAPIAAKKAALAKCAKATKARGKVVVRVAIAADGKATAKIKSSELSDTSVEGCLVKVFSSMTFPTSTGETVLHVPLRLDPDGLKSGV